VYLAVTSNWRETDLDCQSTIDDESTAEISPLLWENLSRCRAGAFAPESVFVQVATGNIKHGSGTFLFAARRTGGGGGERWRIFRAIRCGATDSLHGYFHGDNGSGIGAESPNRWTGW